MPFATTVRPSTDESLVLAPPYDVIDPAEHERLLARHPANVVRLELPRGEPGDEPDDRYRRAARTLAAWRSDGTLHKDPHPSIYVYEQAYLVPGTEVPRVQRGYFARLRLETFGPGVRRPAARADDGRTARGYAYQSTLASMGGQLPHPVQPDKRKETGIAGGDAIVVDLELDAAPRTVEVPADLAAALDTAGLRAAFDALAPSHRKAHVTAIEEAKAAATRERRIAAAVTKIGGPSA